MTSQVINNKTEQLMKLFCLRFSFSNSNAIFWNLSVCFFNVRSTPQSIYIYRLHYRHRVSSFSVVQRKCLLVININIIEDNKTKVFGSIHLTKDVMRLQQVVALIPLLSYISWLFVIAF